MRRSPRLYASRAQATRLRAQGERPACGSPTDADPRATVQRTPWHATSTRSCSPLAPPRLPPVSRPCTREASPKNRGTRSSAMFPLRCPSALLSHRSQTPTNARMPKHPNTHKTPTQHMHTRRPALQEHSRPRTSRRNNNDLRLEPTTHRRAKTTLGARPRAQRNAASTPQNGSQQALTAKPAPLPKTSGVSRVKGAVRPRRRRRSTRASPPGGSRYTCSAQCRQPPPPRRHPPKPHRPRRQPHKPAGHSTPSNHHGLRPQTARSTRPLDKPQPCSSGRS